MHHREHEVTPVKARTGITKREKIFHRRSKTYVITNEARQTHLDITIICIRLPRFVRNDSIIMPLLHHRASAIKSISASANFHVLPASPKPAPAILFQASYGARLTPLTDAAME